MNNFSKKEWIDLVFEGRNKSYGAYELRAKSGNIMLKALFIGIMLVASLASIPVIANHFGDAPVAVVDDITPSIAPKIIPIDKDILKKTEEPVKKDEPEKKLKEKSAEDIIKNKEPQITDELTVKNEVKSVDELAGQKIGAEDIKGSPDGNINAINPGDENISGSIDGIDKGIGEAPGAIFEDFKLDEKAEFPGGIQNFIKTVRKNYKVPDLQTNKYTVYVSFVVETDGSISDIKVIRDPGHGLGDEAIRVLKNIKTKWKPGIYKGEPVRVLYYLPISITII